jgi:hypothetical protein
MFAIRVAEQVRIDGTVNAMVAPRNQSLVARR